MLRPENFLGSSRTVISRNNMAVTSSLNPSDVKTLLSSKTRQTKKERTKAVVDYIKSRQPSKIPKVSLGKRKSKSRT